jgi:hypothetical protein
MNKTSTAVAVAVAALLSIGLSSSLWADDMSMNDEPAADSSTMDQPASMPNTSDINPGDYMEREVYTADGESIGKVDKLVTNNSDHTVYAVVGVGGFLGIGEKDVAIPIDKLQLQSNKLQLASGITKDSLKQQMKYEESEFSAFEAPDESSSD